MPIIHQQFVITGMTCQACANRIEKVLNKKPAIEVAIVNFATETLQVSYDDTKTSQDEIMAWITKAGFGATLDRPTVDAQMPWQLWLLGVLTLPFWIGMIGMMVGSHALMMPVWVQFVLATVVQVAYGAKFYQGAWASIKGGFANMDVLVAIGTTAIWVYSTYIWLTHPDAMHGVYFEASVMVIAFVRLGKYLEHRTKTQSLDNIGLLSQLIPKQVHKQQDGRFIQVLIDAVQVGDVLLANTGDKIAVDGIVISGQAWANEAHLTGESALVHKLEGQMLYAGSVLADGSVTYRACATGAKTQLGDMMTALADAQGSKANIARFADKVSAVFVPVVVAISLLTFGVNLWVGLGVDTSLMRAVAVLVIACPCALGLATPAAIMAGMGVAARHGVWFRDAASLEMAGRTDVMVFDKTGTLTTGRPVVSKWQSLSTDWSDQELIAMTASIEQYATHPLAVALVQFAKAHSVTLYEVGQIQSVTGQGLMGGIEHIGQLKVGTPSFVGMTNWQDDDWRGMSLVAVAIDDVPVAIFGLADGIKPDAKAIIDRFGKHGVTPILMSGDRRSVVDEVASTLGIRQATAQMSPRDKLEAVQALIAQGHQVAMVGDGVNDAPAMAVAQASFAVGGASDVARHSASATLLGESLSHVYYADRIAKATLSTIRQNLFFALIYNCIGILLAAVGLLSPVMAAVAMAMSSISVLMNALRLRRLHLSI